MDTTFRGITRDLPRTNEQFGTPLSPTIRRYHTTPQPFADASEKWCDWTLTTAPNPGGLKNLGTDIVLKHASSFSHPCHTMKSSWEISSSQPYFCLHELCIRLVAGKMIGATNPRGRTWSLQQTRFLRVGDFPSSVMQKLKLSASMALCILKCALREDPPNLSWPLRALSPSLEQGRLLACSFWSMW